VSHGSEKRAWVFTGPKASGKRADRLILGVEGFEPGLDERYGGRLRAGMSGSVEACYMLLRAVCDGIPHPVGFSLNWEPLTWGAPGWRWSWMFDRDFPSGGGGRGSCLCRPGWGPLEAAACLPSRIRMRKSGELPGPRGCTPGARAGTQLPPQPPRPNLGRSAAGFVVPSSHALPGFVTDSARIILRHPGGGRGSSPLEPEVP